MVVKKQMVPPGSAAGELEMLAGEFTAKDFIARTPLPVVPPTPGMTGARGWALALRTWGQGWDGWTTASCLHHHWQGLRVHRMQSPREKQRCPVPSGLEPGTSRGPRWGSRVAKTPPQTPPAASTWGHHIVPQTGALFGVKGTTIHHIT